MELMYQATANVQQSRRCTECRTEAEVASIDRNVAPHIATVNITEGNWERIPIKVDSRAIGTVMPPNVAEYFDLVDTEASRKGPGFWAANGTPVKHQSNTMGSAWCEPLVTNTTDCPSSRFEYDVVLRVSAAAI